MESGLNILAFDLNVNSNYVGSEYFVRDDAKFYSLKIANATLFTLSS
jgi:hypothetical protein